MGFWTFILILIVAALAVLSWFDRRDWLAPPAIGPSQTEEELRRLLLLRAGLNVSHDRIARLSAREFDEAWAFVDALRTSDPETEIPVPRFLERRASSRGSA